MKQPRKLLLEPDWPRMRQSIARKLGKTEDQIQAMFEKGDSLDQVELVMTIEEVLEELHR
jgi:acyl carrier protein